jgi:hypothetical protein
MKRTTLMLAAVLSLLLFGCDKSNDLDRVDSPKKGKVITLTAKMPVVEEDSKTRMGLEESVNYVVMKWEKEREGDEKIYLLLVQDGIKKKDSTTVSDISADGKSAKISIVVPEEFDQSGKVDIYGVYGGQGLDDTDPSIAILPANPGEANGLAGIAANKLFMIKFKALNVDLTDNINEQLKDAQFEDMGSWFWMKGKQINTDQDDHFATQVFELETPGYIELWPSTGTGFMEETTSDIEDTRLWSNQFLSSNTAVLPSATVASTFTNSYITVADDGQFATNTSNGTYAYKTGLVYNTGAGGAKYDLINETYVDPKSDGTLKLGIKVNDFKEDTELSFWAWYPIDPNQNFPKSRIHLYGSATETITISGIPISGWGEFHRITRNKLTWANKFEAGKTYRFYMQYQRDAVKPDWKSSKFAVVAASAY